MIDSQDRTKYCQVAVMGTAEGKVGFFYPFRVNDIDYPKSNSTRLRGSTTIVAAAEPLAFREV